MDTPNAVKIIDGIRESASNPNITAEELQSLLAASLELTEVAIEAIVHFQVAEQLMFMATGIKVPPEIVSLAVDRIVNAALEE
jgi:hypothetical protein